MASRAEAFFQQIRDIKDEPARVAFIHKLVSDKTHESEYLDFKSGKIQNNEDDLKKHWSKALSGYANVGGGVLVFGVDARKKGGSNLECYSVAPVAKPDELHQRLIDFHRAATDEVVRGVDYLIVKESDGTGYVVALVPEGDRKPYRAMQDGSKGGIYYQRTSDSFLTIPHAMLRTLFYPRLLPHLQLEIKLRYYENREIQLTGSIVNHGVATARDIMLMISANKEPKNMSGHGRFKLTNTWKSGGLNRSRHEASSPLHVGDRVLCFRCDFEPKSITDLYGLKMGAMIYSTDQEPIFLKALYDFRNFDDGSLMVPERQDANLIEEMRQWMIP